jgi:hypothetical protein
MFGTPAGAQSSTSGAIRGKTVDLDGNVLPGVIVTLTSEALPGSQPSSVSDAEGEVRFTNLPVGRYSLVASLDGFQQQSAENIRVSLGSAASVTIFMHPDAFTGEIRHVQLRRGVYRRDADPE